MSSSPWPILGFMLPVAVLMACLAVVMLRNAYHLLLGPGVGWAELEERYGHSGPGPENTKVTFMGQASRMSTHVGSDETGMYIAQSTMFRSRQPLKIPWESLVLDLDAGLFVIVKIVPEGMCFTFHRWFLGRETLQRLKGKPA